MYSYAGKVNLLRIHLFCLLIFPQVFLLENIFFIKKNAIPYKTDK